MQYLSMRHSFLIFSSRWTEKTLLKSRITTCGPREVKTRLFCASQKSTFKSFVLNNQVAFKAKSIHSTEVYTNDNSNGRQKALPSITRNWFENFDVHNSKQKVKRQNLCEILESSDEELDRLIVDNRMLFRSLQPIVILQILHFLKDNNVDVSGKYLKENLWLLNFYPIEEKFEVLKSLFTNTRIKSHYLPLLMANKQHIRHAIRIWPTDSTILQDKYETRLEYISSLLEWPINDICKTAANRHHPLITLPLTRIQTIFELLIENGVEKESIVRDLWIIRHNISVMKERISICNQLQVPVKVWLLRSAKQIFENSINRTSNNNRVLHGHKDTIDYLANKLQCSRSTILDIGAKNPNVMKINATKLEEKINFLLNLGLTVSDIKFVPRILKSKNELISSRYQQLLSLGMLPVTPGWARCLVDKQLFQYYLDNAEELQFYHSQINLRTCNKK